MKRAVAWASVFVKTVRLQVVLAFKSRRVVSEQIAAGLYNPVEYCAAVMAANIPLQFVFIVTFALPVFYLAQVCDSVKITEWCI